MAEETSSKGNQIVQTLLVVIISVLLTAVLVLFLKKNDQAGGGSDSAVAAKAANEAGTEETDQELLTRIQRDASVMSARLGSKDGALDKALSDLEIAQLSYERNLAELGKIQEEKAALLTKLGNADVVLGQLNNAKLEVTSYKKILENLNKELEEFKSKNYAVKNTNLELTIEELKNKLSAAQLKYNSRIKSVDDLTGEKNRQQALVIALTNENEELKKRLSNLQIKFNRAQLFVNEAKNLDPKAATLFTSLKAMNGTTGPALSLGYKTLASRLGVHLVRQVKFAEGSAFIPEMESGLIGQDMKGSGASSYFLVVGYASTTGSADLNKELSAKRATSTATVVQQLKAQGQQVKAVYLGQTKRFSATKPSENQVCEIWEIKK